jgi:hypothetical protein
MAARDDKTIKVEGHYRAGRVGADVKAFMNLKFLGSPVIDNLAEAFNVQPTFDVEIDDTYRKPLLASPDKSGLDFFYNGNQYYNNTYYGYGGDRFLWKYPSLSEPMLLPTGAGQRLLYGGPEYYWGRLMRGYEFIEKPFEAFKNDARQELSGAFLQSEDVYTLKDNLTWEWHKQLKDLGIYQPWVIYTPEVSFASLPDSKISVAPEPSADQIRTSYRTTRSVWPLLGE